MGEIQIMKKNDKEHIFQWKIKNDIPFPTPGILWNYLFRKLSELIWLGKDMR